MRHESRVEGWTNLIPDLTLGGCVAADTLEKIEYILE